MGWTRTKALTTEPPAPLLLIWWLLAGMLMAIVGLLLFIVHASGKVSALSEMNIWWVSLLPVGIWLLLFFFRCYLWGRAWEEYQFLQQEAKYGQQQWEAWSERWLAILGNVVLLPDHITAACLEYELPQHYGRCQKIDQLTAETSPAVSAIRLLINGAKYSLQRLPPELPLTVTLIHDNASFDPQESFVSIWKECIPERKVPADITVTDTFSFANVEERLKQPVLTVNLLLILQVNGGEVYSDGLAALLLTSDDVAKKYHLPHAARLLRPMPLDMAKFADDLALFLETQPTARRTTSIIGDVSEWMESCATLITQGVKMNAAWEAEDISLLEKWCGIPGPFSPWLLTALTADLVTLRKQPQLVLFSEGKERFISTIASGSEDEYTG
ncbi:type VI secretion protein [Intestinirhabdus alba]|jgi:hypothetical protein|uniref:Type VI secretion protein n=1 Tax=Intestinirhabdus alba TaxID=2899544 RepID=A0A6L6IU04_9ENTR|nr:type VI secretion protein [Intestinirhabdus alba]MTH48866.1 type VI secretion protein [Intestinirhabdus alba]